ncbi:MAG: YncE family protein, partial [Alcaligenaceae bacterium]|nr:YncE family protein [Alcaligenaceae bacterium]
TLALSAGCATTPHASAEAATATDEFIVQYEPLAPGLYESAYGAKTGHLYVTSAVGRPPVKTSQLLKVDPAGLTIEARTTPPLQAGRDDGQLQAVYGVDIDDARGRVWVTNTRGGSIAVYRESDLGLIKQFPEGTVPHSRDVLVDSANTRVYVSSPASNLIHVFDATTLAPLQEIAVQGPGTETPKLMGLALDAAHGKLYAVSLNTNELFVIDTAGRHLEHAYALPGAQGASGVAVDSQGGRVYVASQKSGNVLIVDAANGTVLHDVATGAGALNVAFDPKSRLAYVANRKADTITVLDSEGRIHAQIPTGSAPNHITIDDQGDAYVLNKGKGKNDPTANRITRIHAGQ